MRMELTKSVVQSPKYARTGHYIVADDRPDAPTGEPLKALPKGRKAKTAPADAAGDNWT